MAQTDNNNNISTNLVNKKEIEELKGTVKSCTKLDDAAEGDFHEKTKQLYNSIILVTYDVLVNSPKEGTYIVPNSDEVGPLVFGSTILPFYDGAKEDEELVVTNIEQSPSLPPSEFMANKGLIQVTHVRHFRSVELLGCP
ncbi:hypothetical protein VNO78_33361 [Psophocarpus tetragonolobus]|uniref:Uncharacterized protein n=1 Tax=Psophocarpus tetragonolobus TaxID=3891 RepID=A0AAN9P101_PSOTE